MKPQFFGALLGVTLVLSNLVICLTFGLILAVLLRRVWRMAASAPTQASEVSVVLVLGLRLQHNQLTADFTRRLDRAIQLFHTHHCVPSLIISGGLTGHNKVTEAAAGQAYLHQQGLPNDKIVLEDQSAYTLDNLRYARRLIGQQAAVFVSNRYHLYRSVTLARGLGLNILPVAAEQRWRVTPVTCLHVLKEAYYLHWYGCHGLCLMLWRWISP